MKEEHFEPFFTNDAVIFGILMTLLAIIFKTAASKNPGWQKFYKVIPTILLCYFLPSLLNTFGLVDAEESKLYFVASRYLLPACLVLLTLSVDLKEVIRLGPKALVMFFTATIGVVIGGPLAILIVSAINPEFVGGIGPDAVWRGMTTIAGSWIGGSANQAAMYELFQPTDTLFSVSITVDVIVAELWMAALLLGIGRTDRIDHFFKADNSAITTLKDKMEAYSLSIAKIPTLADFMIILAIGFGATGFAHFIADIVAPYIGENAPYLKNFSLDSQFFWIVVISTAIGVIFSFTKLRQLEGAGASKIGTVFIFILVASIGMKMDVLAILENPGFFLVGLVWMIIHAALLIIVARLIHAPYFFLAVGSKANIGGAASAPVLAAAFHPSLAPVGVLLAVLGYALGTYGAWLCGILMQVVAK
ncbi:DUF819 domain-containing protein [Fulvivirga imtechensis AK7]|uniref:DUF819 domain-containing protein n=1 Tax=Fulvivirga imtechensis AK7 TaxID=1237149 RepID=L8JWK7_9BACT|nr:DUF819 family protein [Fulvivirga imtechensis]ELR71597.1 DUF819 domain-containing protein [Fulvivirga imtechensis AK7]